MRMTNGTRAVVRYLNLVGDRYLELVDGPGGRKLPPGSQIPTERTAPALDLDLLLGGLKPVIRGPQSARRQRAYGVADPDLAGPGRHAAIAAVQHVVVHHRVGRPQPDDPAADRQPAHVAVHPDQGGREVLRHDRPSWRRWSTELAAEKDPIGTAIDSLNNGTASVADLLTDARPPLKGTVDQLNRLAPNLDGQKDRLDAALQKAPENYRKLIRTGSYGSFFNYYLCDSSSGRPTFRAAPRCSRGSGKTGGGAPNPDAEIPWNQAHPDGIHRRRARDPASSSSACRPRR